jgi:hypothetical protein
MQELRHRSPFGPPSPTARRSRLPAQARDSSSAATLAGARAPRNRRIRFDPQTAGQPAGRLAGATAPPAAAAFASTRARQGAQFSAKARPPATRANKQQRGARELFERTCVRRGSAPAAPEEGRRLPSRGPRGNERTSPAAVRAAAAFADAARTRCARSRVRPPRRRALAAAGATSQLSGRSK